MQTVILLMAGNGTRLNLNINKMMYKVNSKRLYQYSLDSFLKFDLKVILVVNKDDYDIVKSEVSKDICVVIGGKTRNESVMNALEYVKTSRVLIHDAARALISDDIINSCINSKSKLYYVCVPLKDTLRNSKTNKTLNREEYFSVQTPQGGNTELFKKYEKNSTFDDISSFDDLDIEIERIKGSNYNFKITTNFDLEVFKLLQKEKK